MSISSKLKGDHTVGALKKLIKEKYKIPDKCDVVAIYGDTIISHDDGRKLKEFGLTSDSL
eukprot:CAMPEP_0197026234 /NCGR_PEP_ID=MMETSP1384-20130603/6376_1 /TAXON_ID=29189 /ORGANISM="Ammonia sp." /LENGTH=59 /DNA_ID=CAMNT_0042454873 /DNA_START=48 /DNA_END=224 /DNA_ORIENTATION=-